MLNLERVAARCAQAMVGEAPQAGPKGDKAIEVLERLATKALGVLQQQGVYACMLFLTSRTSDEASLAPVICQQLLAAACEVPGLAEHIPAGNAVQPAVLRFYTEHVLGDLDMVLLIRGLYEQTLIYARYGAKAAQT